MSLWPTLPDLDWGSAAAWWGVGGLAVVTLFSRAIFLLPARTPQLPPWLWRGLAYAPLAALVALIVPELRPVPGLAPWRDPRAWAVAAALAVHVWRRNVHAPILAGTLVLLLAWHRI